MTNKASSWPPQRRGAVVYWSRRNGMERNRILYDEMKRRYEPEADNECRCVV